MALLKISLEWDPEGGLAEHKRFEVYGTGPQDLAMLSAARGWLDGLYKAAEEGMKSNPFGDYIEKVLEVMKPKEIIFPPPIQARPVGRVGASVLTAKGPIELLGPSLEVVEEAAAILEMAQRLVVPPPGSDAPGPGSGA